MSYKGITLLQIDYFFAVAKYLNFTEAAKKLYVSQPSLSKQIAVLEQELGVQLFFRTKRDVRLTPAGVVLLRELDGVSKQIMNAIEKCKIPDLGENSTITIGCLEAMNTGLFLSKIIKSFKEKHKMVKIVLERHSFKELREKFIKGDLDVIFTLSFEIDNSLDVVWDVVCKENSSIVMEADHPLAGKDNLTLNDFKDENFLSISREECPRGIEAIVKLCKKNGFTPKIVKELPNIESLLLCVESGLGVALVDYNIRTFNSEGFKFFKLEEDILNIVMAWKKENLNPVVQLFTNSVLNDTKL